MKSEEKEPFMTTTNVKASSKKSSDSCCISIMEPKTAANLAEFE